MVKAPAAAGDSALRAIPSVERILSNPRIAPLAETFSRTRVKEAVTAHLASLRAARQPWDEDAALGAIALHLRAATGSTLRRVINATGVIIHTNLGRSPIDAALWAEAAPLVSGYSNLEFDLGSGARGRRDEHLAELCRSVFGCEAALLTNNNAAGTLLLLAAVAAGKEVVVSRGELVEIGGSFRVPDVIQQGGAKLREVGTTNRTRAADYANAIGENTAAILRVHRSNFEIVGFTEQPSIAELVAVAREHHVPMLYDEGSGRVVDLSAYGFAKQETIRELMDLGVDAVTCSTDKLLGATQGGLILGRREIIDRCRKHPLMRALRAGKESYAVIAATLRAFATGRQEAQVPIYRMLATPLDELRARAASLGGRVVETRCALGGGTTPAETAASIAIEVDGDANEQYARLLADEPPIVGRIADDKLLLDLRTVLPEDLPQVAAALNVR